MKPFFLAGDLCALLVALDHIDLPAILIEVDHSGECRFAGTNPSYEACTGILGSQIAGQKPADLLPSRHCEALEQRYAHCVTSRRSLTYDEEFDLPHGKVRWRTTLSPILAGGDVTALVALSSDVSSLQSQIEELSGRTTMPETGLADMAAANQMRVPLNDILGFCRILRTELQAAAGRKAEILDQLSRTALGALQGIDDLTGIATLRGPGVAGDIANVDFAKLCHRLAARVDPGERLTTTFPNLTLTTNEDAFRTILTMIFEQASCGARSWIGLSATPDRDLPDHFQLLVRCDLFCGGGLADFDTDWMDEAVRARGGFFHVSTSENFGRAQPCATFQITLPGQVEAAKTSVMATRTAGKPGKRPATANG